MSWDYLDLADYLLIAEAVLDIPAEDIAKATRCGSGWPARCVCRTPTVRGAIDAVTHLPHETEPEDIALSVLRTMLSGWFVPRAGSRYEPPGTSTAS